MPITIPMSAGKMLSSDGTTWIDKYPPGYTLATDLGSTYTGNGSTTPETSILAAAAATTGLFPAAVAIGDSFEITVRGSTTNNSGGGATDRIRVYHGAYTLVDVTSASLTSSASPRTWGIRVVGVIEVVGAVNVAKIRLVGERVGFNTQLAGGTGWTPVPSNALEVSDGASSGTNANLATNAARDFNVTSTHSVNSASMSTTLNVAQVLWRPKNY